MQDHRFEAGTCVYCGAALLADGTIPPLHRACVERPAAARPEPARRQYAIDDGEAIGQRLRELEAERVASLGRSALVGEYAFSGFVDDKGALMAPERLWEMCDSARRHMDSVAATRLFGHAGAVVAGRGEP